MSTRTEVVLLSSLGACLAALAASSIGRPIYLDTPILMYAGFLIDRKHLVPYRDFFDMNMPGAYAANVAAGRLFGYTDLGARSADLLMLACLLAITWVIMRRFGHRLAWWAPIWFGVIYLASGEWMTLQREYLLLLPLSGAVGIVLSRRIASSWKAWLAGLLVGIGGTIKPHALLALPFLVGSVAAEARRVQPGRRRWPLVAGSVAGAASPLALMTYYLWHNGALASFADIALNYWPLYNALSGTRPHRILAGADRWEYVFSRTIAFGIHPGLPLAAAATIGTVDAVCRSTLSSDSKRAVWLLVGLAVCFTVYVGVAGKFWMYHWLPFQYFAVLLGSLAFAEPPPHASHRRSTRAAFVLMCAAVPWSFGPFRPSYDLPFDKVQAIATYLTQHLDPGDTVQPLDWTEGAVHAMLLAQAPPATPFLYEFYFHHHVSSPYIQHLRRRLLVALEQATPRLIIRIERPAFAGPDTSADFDELTRFIAARYEKAVAADGYEIWRCRSAGVAERRSERPAGRPGERADAPAPR